MTLYLTACPKPLNVIAIVAGVIGGIVLIGIALFIIWKILISIHDRREFAKFEKERYNVNWKVSLYALK